MKKLICFLLIIVSAFSCKKEKKLPEQSTNNFLSGVNYDKIYIELAYQDGMQPSPQTVSALKNFLENLVNKGQGIEILQRNINLPAKSVYTYDELRSLESSYRTAQDEGKTATAYIFFTGGEYSENSGSSKVLGIAYGPSSIVMFEKTIQSLSGGLTQPSTVAVETSVVEHEFGHLLGLVNNGTPMVDTHQDEAHGNHCNNSKCLMYYASETSDIVANLLNNNVPVLDENCLKDLKNNGGR